MTDGGGSDFLSSQILARFEQISFSFFFRMLVSGSRHTYNFVSSKSRITTTVELKKQF